MNDGNRVYPVVEGFIHHSAGPEFNGGESAVEIQDWFSNVGKSRGYTDKNGRLISSFHEHPSRPGQETYAMAHWALRRNPNATTNGYDGWELIELIKDPWRQVAWSVGNWEHNQRSVSIEVCGNWLGRSLPDEALQVIANNFRPQDKVLGGGFSVWGHMWVYATQCPGALINQIDRIVEFLNNPPAPHEPVPAPEPQNEVLVDDPEYIQTYQKLGARQQIPTEQEAFAIDMTSEGAPVHVPAGTPIDVAGFFENEGKKYVRTAYSEDNNKWYGLSTDAFEKPSTGQPADAEIPVTVVPAPTTVDTSQVDGIQLPVKPTKAEKIATTLSPLLKFLGWLVGFFGRLNILALIKKRINKE